MCVRQQRDLGESAADDAGRVHCCSSSPLFMMYRPIKKLSRVNANLQQAIAAAERIFEMLDTRHRSARTAPGRGRWRRCASGIEFREVSFEYDDGSGDYVLRNVSFRVAAGQMLAIVGLSGAGKTTLVNLIPRFYDVAGGRHLRRRSGRARRDLRSLRAQIGIVTQDTVLFDDTIAANIAYGRPERDRRGDRSGGARGARARVHRVAGRRLRHVDRRARPAAVGRPAAAAGDRPRAAQGSADPDSRRSDVVARRGVRAAGAGGAREPDAQPHRVRDRAPAVHGAARRRHHRARARTDRRDRPARGAAGDSRRRLCEAVCAAAVRRSRNSKRRPRPSAPDARDDAMR